MVLVHYGVTSSRNKCLQHGKFHAAGCQPDLVGWKMRWPELPHSLWSVKLDRDWLTDAHPLWDLIAALRSTLSHCCIMFLQTTVESCFSLECLTNVLAQILFLILPKPFLFSFLYVTPFLPASSFFASWHFSPFCSLPYFLIPFSFKFSLWTSLSILKD